MDACCRCFRPCNVSLQIRQRQGECVRYTVPSFGHSAALSIRMGEWRIYYLLDAGVFVFPATKLAKRSSRPCRRGFDPSGSHLPEYPSPSVLGISVDSVRSLLKCFDIVKRLCLSGMDRDYIDRKFCLENAQNGTIRLSSHSGTGPCLSR